MITISTNNLGRTTRKHSSRKPQLLTDEQKRLIKGTLAEYDPSALSEDDARAIVETLRAANIRVDHGLASAMAEFGFDAKVVGDLAGVKAPASPGDVPTVPEPQQPQPNISDDELRLLDRLLDDYHNAQLSSEQKEALLAEIKRILKQASFEGGLVDLKA